MARLLVIDDEPQILRLLTISLESQQHEVFTATLGKQGLAMLAVEQPDLVILDLGLPDIDGQEVLRRLREFSDVPVIVLSVRSHEKDKVQALDSGANDYLEKPFGVKELLARIRATLRTRLATDQVQSNYDDGHLRIDYLGHIVTLQGERVRLSPKEYDLLVELAKHPGQILTQHYLLKKFWGPSHVDDSHYLRIFVRQIRTKLGDDPMCPKYIETEPGVGYRFLGGDEAPP